MSKEEREYKQTLSFIKNQLEQYNIEDITNKQELINKYNKQSNTTITLQDIKSGKIKIEDLDYDELLKIKKKDINIRKISILQTFKLSFSYYYKNHFLVDKKNYNEYKYKKDLKKSFIKQTLSSLMTYTTSTLVFYAWMRLLKHKSKKDKAVVFFYITGISILYGEKSSYRYVTNTPFPLSPRDIDKRREFVENMVFTIGYTNILIDEIKSLSLSLGESEIHNYRYILPTTNTVCDVCTFKDKLYTNCKEYDKVFKKKNSHKEFAIMNLHNKIEFEMLIGILKLYYILIKKFKEKHGINDNENNDEELYVMDLIDTGKLGVNDLVNLKKAEDVSVKGYTNLLNNVDYNKVIEYARSKNSSEKNEAIVKDLSNTKDTKESGEISINKKI